MDTDFRFFKKRTLIISPEPWDFIKVSKHHYAQTLAKKDNLVYFLNPPDKKINGVQCISVAENLFVLDYRDPFTGTRFFPKAVRKYLNKLLYNKIQRSAQSNFDVVILFENSRFYDLDFLPKNVLSIYFQVDEDQNFHPDIASKSADLVLAINDIIQKILSKFSTPVFKIPHGFSGKFSDVAMRIYRGDRIYKKPDGKLKAYYVGNLDHNFCDANLIASLVLKRQDVDFVFIGPYLTNGKLFSLIKDCKNVHFSGQVPAKDIPKLLDEADLLFFAYTDGFLSSSHKVMEYLASGKAIVATQVNGYPEDPDLFFCSGTPDKFIELFHGVCVNIQAANSPDKMKKRIQYAMDNTYESRISQIENLVRDTYTNG